MINWALIGALLLPPVGGFTMALVSHVKKPAGTAFYRSLNKPFWTPPSFVFAPVWLCLYLSMGYASYMVYRDGSAAKIPLALYVAQLAVNWTWKLTFFRFHRIGWALTHIIILDILAAATTASFARVNPTTAYFMVPYLCWLGIATALNFEFWRLNRSNGGKKDEDYTKHEKFHYIT